MEILTFVSAQKALNAILTIKPINLSDEQAEQLFHEYPNIAHNSPENRAAVRSIAQVKVTCFGKDQAHYCLFLKLDIPPAKPRYYILKVTEKTLSVMKIK